MKQSEGIEDFMNLVPGQSHSCRLQELEYKHVIVLFNSLLGTVDLKMSRSPLIFIFCISTLNFAEGRYSALGLIHCNVPFWVSHVELYHTY